MTQPVIMPPDQIRDVMTMPEGYESIGELSIPCSDSSSSGALVVLDTVDLCQLDRMEETMKAAASRVGGELLVQRHCDTDSRVTKRFVSESMYCRAVVARRIGAGNAGTTYGVPNSQLPKALRGLPAKTPIDPAVIDATTPYNPPGAP